MNKPFIKAGYAGILLIIISAALMAVNPGRALNLPQGFFNPVIAFEFIRTETEVYDLFGNNGSSEQGTLVGSFKNGTYIDFLFIVAYAAFLLVFSNVCRRITGSKWFIFSGFIILSVVISDIGENIQLLTIMKKLSLEDFGKELMMLNFFTWAKWGGLTALFISFIPFLRNSGRFGRVISVTALLSGVTGAAAFLHRSVLNEIYVLTVEVIFVMLIIFSFTFVYNKQPDK